ncbi:hypothetical protein RRG08_006899 [Elysia crispata]|uniref:Uncharacterized protein n=1 Tax=Elysia crispata TaxID=231223 RepID=A0AAE1AN01_9GAST|nr:hypothetical protein RRG08_006899 [Elysia crispata]
MNRQDSQSDYPTAHCQGRDTGTHTAQRSHGKRKEMNRQTHNPDYSSPLQSVTRRSHGKQRNEQTDSQSDYNSPQQGTVTRVLILLSVASTANREMNRQTHNQTKAEVHCRGHVWRSHSKQKMNRQTHNQTQQSTCRGRDTGTQTGQHIVRANQHRSGHTVLKRSQHTQG